MYPVLYPRLPAEPDRRRRLHLLPQNGVCLRTKTKTLACHRSVHVLRLAVLPAVPHSLILSGHDSRKASSGEYRVLALRKDTHTGFNATVRYRRFLHRPARKPIPQEMDGLVGKQRRCQIRGIGMNHMSDT